MTVGVSGVIRPSGDTATNPLSASPTPSAPSRPATRLARRRPRSSNGASTGGDGTAASVPSNHRSTRATNAGSRRSSSRCVIRPLRVSRLNANCTGSNVRYRDTFSKYDALTFAASWNRSTTGCRSISYSTSAAGTSRPRRNADASDTESSMASLVPDPIVKCAVCAASPSSTTFP